VHQVSGYFISFKKKKPKILPWARQCAHKLIRFSKKHGNNADNITFGEIIDR
jgi:hypothetical protein